MNQPILRTGDGSDRNHLADSTKKLAASSSLEPWDIIEDSRFNSTRE